MNMEEFYHLTGGNYADVMRRLHDEGRMAKFLSKFTEDPSFSLLCRALEDGDGETAFRAAHSLKGICMNLGLARLQESSSTLTENLRSLTPDDKTPMLLEQVQLDYSETCAMLNELLNR